MVSELIQEAYNDGCDYFYQINDDTIMNTRGWADTLTSALRNNPLGYHVGVTGPTDTNNVRILTHAFVHRYYSVLHNYRQPRQEREGEQKTIRRDMQ